MKYRVEFFRPEEFICPCCHAGQIAASLAYFLDELRRAWNMPIIVNSGWRCARHNREVGGAERSRHLIGCAADIKPNDPQLIGPFQNLLGDMAGRREGWEIKNYQRFCHVAVPREEEAQKWGGGLLHIAAKSATPA